MFFYSSNIIYFLIAQLFLSKMISILTTLWTFEKYRKITTHKATRRYFYIFLSAGIHIYTRLPQNDKQRLYAIQYLLFSSLIFQNGCIILIGKFYANDVKQETLGICSRSFRKPRAGTSRRTQGAETENWSAWAYPVCFWGAMQLFVLFPLPASLFSSS